MNNNNQSQMSIRSEQIFNKQNIQLVPKQNSTQAIPYNYTPHVDIHKAIKTKFAQRDILNQSAQFDDPAQYSRADINLLEQSVQKQQQMNYRDAQILDEINQIEIPQDSKQQIRLFLEPPILIPYLIDFVRWEPKKIQQIALAQGDYKQVFNNFKAILTDQIMKLDHKYMSGRDAYEFFGEQIKLDQQIKDLEQNLNTLKLNITDFFQNCSYQELQQKGWIQFENKLGNLQREIYQIRLKCFDVKNMCDYQDDQITYDTNFIERYSEYSVDFKESYTFFYERSVIYILHEDLGIERIFTYIRNPEIDERPKEELCEEVQFYLEMPEYPSFLEETTDKLRELARQLILFIDEIFKQAKSLKVLSEQIFKDLIQDIDNIEILFIQIPTMIKQLSLAIQEAKNDLLRIQIPFTNSQAENNELLKDFDKKNEEAKQLVMKIKYKIEKANLKYQQSNQQKAVVEQQLEQMNQNLLYNEKLYLLVQQLPDKEYELQKVQTKRQELIASNKLINSEDLQANQNQELDVLKAKCESLLNDIQQCLDAFDNPHQFIKIKQWCTAEIQALSIKFTKKFLQAPQLNIRQRLDTLMKWEFDGQPRNQEQEEEKYGENSEIVKYLSFIHDIDVKSQINSPPQIERDLMWEFVHLKGQDYQELFQLNEDYNIWKNMQAAGIFLNQEYIVNLINKNNNDEFMQFKQRQQQLLLFFKVNARQNYIDYILDIISLVDFVMARNKQQAIQLVEKSKGIPKFYKNALNQCLQN